MGFTEINGKWVSKDGEQGGSSSGLHVEHGEEDQEDVEGADMDILNAEQPATDFGAGISVGHQGDKTLSMSSFESYMVNRLDGFVENQRNLHDLCVSNFQEAIIDFKAWIHIFKLLMNRLKMLRIKFLSCSMEKKTEEKQLVDFSKQLIVKLESQGFVVLSIFVLLYFELFFLISS